jgi:co-chaperonin GroES (HSP10)
MEKKYQPLEDRVLIEEKKKSELETTDAGLIKVENEKPELYGVVKKVGGGKYAFETGEFIETTLKEGDNVIFGRGVGMPLELDLGDGKKEYVLMREGDVLIKI